MLNLFERDVLAAEQRLVVLAPSDAVIPDSLQNLKPSPAGHQQLVHDVQRLRGSIYLRDGALKSHQLTSDGRHVTPEDSRAWHLLILNEQRKLTGCIWYLEHRNRPTVDQLRVRDSPLSRGEWRERLHGAVAAETGQALSEGISCAEVGGWAVECGSQCVSAALLLILGTYSLSQIAGGALVFATATVRHSSAKILRRLGGSLLQGNGFQVPPYYDPRYDCEMELLRFDTRRPTPKYASVVRALVDKMVRVPVYANSDVPAAASMPVRVPAMRRSVLVAA